MANHITNYLYVILGIVPFAYVRYHPFFNKLRINKKIFFIIFMLLSVIEAFIFDNISSYGSFMGISDRDKFLRNCYFFYFLLSMIIIKEDFVKNIFVWFFSFIVSSFVIAACLLSELFFDLPVEYGVYTLTMILILPTFIFFSLRYIKKVIIPLVYETDIKILRICTIIVALVFFMVLISSSVLSDAFHINTVEKNVGAALFAIRVFGALTTLLVCFLLKRIMDNQVEIDMLTHRQYLQETMLAVSKEQFSNLSQKIEETKRARHDIRHHLTAIKVHIEKKDMEGLTSYVDELVKGLPTNKTLLFCENTTVHNILSYYYEKSNHFGIDIAIDAKIPKDLILTDSELWVLLGNLLENAIEGSNRAESDKKEIKVKLFYKGNTFGVLVENTCDENKINRADKEYLSSKGEQHGIGIESVTYLVKKYDGIAEFRVFNSKFIASIVMSR